MQLQLGGAVVPHRHHVRSSPASLSQEIVAVRETAVVHSRGQAKCKKHVYPEGYVCTKKMHTDGHGPSSGLTDRDDDFQ